jgi:plastocyanin
MTNTSKKSKSNNGYLALVSAAIANVLLLSSAGTLSLSSAQVQGQGLVEQQQQQDQLQLLLGNFTSQNDTRTVAAGGGGPISVVTWFVPQNISITAGETVTWVNPSLVSEPHTVSFMKDPSYFANYESPYLIANGTEITPANPQEKNTEPLIIPSQTSTTDDTILVANKRQAIPVAIDTQNNAEYLSLNANYTMTGDELYVNSGIIFPESAIPPGAPPITSFSVTFENAGTYDYLCQFHPWMTGRVIVE